MARARADLGLRVRLRRDDDDTTLDYDDLERKLTERTRVVAFPLASNAVGTLTDAQRIVELAHDAGALAWADAVHYGPHGPIDVADLGVDVLLCSPYKFFGPHLGLAFVRGELTEQWRTYKVRPATTIRSRPARSPHELLAGFVAAVEYIESIGWEPIQAHERALGQRFLDGLPDTSRSTGCRRWTAACRRSRSTSTATAARVAEHLAERDIAVWDGNYYAVEVMQRLGLGRRRRSRRVRPLQHGGRGRPAARGARRTATAVTARAWAGACVRYRDNSTCAPRDELVEVAVGLVEEREIVLYERPKPPVPGDVLERVVVVLQRVREASPAPQAERLQRLPEVGAPFHTARERDGEAGRGPRRPLRLHEVAFGAPDGGEGLVQAHAAAGRRFDAVGVRDARGVPGRWRTRSSS